MAKKKEQEGKAQRAQDIVQTAMALFSAHGFDKVTTRQIAAAAGLNIATVHHHVGTKRQLYQQVLDSLQAEEHAVLAEYLQMVQEMPDDDAQALQTLIFRAVDTHIDLVLKNPLRARLYMRRWLETDIEEASVEHHENALLLHNTLLQLLESLDELGRIDLKAQASLLLRSLDWLTYGYFVTGPVENNSWLGDPYAPESLSAFRSLVHAYVSAMLGFDGEK